MTRASNGNGTGEPPAAELVVVHVTDTISTTLAGHDGVEYQSPPQPRAEALDLVRVLVGDDPSGLEATEPRWRCPIAGGQRTITLERARPTAASQRGPAEPSSPPSDRAPASQERGHHHPLGRR